MILIGTSYLASLVTVVMFHYRTSITSRLFSIRFNRHRTATINGILSKLHVVERNLGENCLNNESELRQLESNYQSKAATRKKALENAQGQLDAEWARNREIEAEIREVIDHFMTINVDYF